MRILPRRQRAGLSRVGSRQSALPGVRGAPDCLDVSPPELPPERSRDGGRAEDRSREALPFLPPPEPGNPRADAERGVHPLVRDERARKGARPRRLPGPHVHRLPRRAPRAAWPGIRLFRQQGRDPARVREVPRDGSRAMGRQRPREGSCARPPRRADLHGLPRRAQHPSAPRSELPGRRGEHLGPRLHALPRLAPSVPEVQSPFRPRAELRGQLPRAGRARRRRPGRELRELPWSPRHSPAPPTRGPASRRRTSRRRAEARSAIRARMPASRPAESTSR